MDGMFYNLCLDDDSFEEEKLEPLEEKELKLMKKIKNFIKKRKYKNIPLLFSTGKNAASNLEILPKMCIHLFRDVCRKYLTEGNYEDNRALYKSVEQLMEHIANVAPADSILFEFTKLIDPDKPDCVFFSVLSVAVSPLLRVKDVAVVEDFLDEIALRKDVCLPIPTILLSGNNAEKEACMSASEEIDYITLFHSNIFIFTCPLVSEFCSPANREKEIFRSCKSNRQNVMCCFLLKMLEEPLALFDLNCSEPDGRHKRPLFFAVSLTHAITECIGDPYFLLNFVEQNWSSPRDMPSSNKENFEGANHFLKELPLEAECLAVYYYMVIVEGVGSSQVPKVYHPLYVCEKVLHLVHYILAETKFPTLHEKALRLARKVISSLGHIKLQASDLELYIHKTFLDDLRKAAHNVLSIQALLETTEVLKEYVLCFDDASRYTILKNLLETSTDPNFSGFLIGLYKLFAAEALKTPSEIPLPEIYTGLQIQTMLMENICILQHGAKTDPAKNNYHLEAALQIILMLSKSDTENRTGFWSYIDDIHAQFITPLREALQLYEGRFKSELVNARHSRDNVKNFSHSVSQLKKTKRINDLKNNVTDIVKLRILASVVCESLSKISIDDRNNNTLNLKSAKA